MVDDSTALKLTGTGMALGVVHVLTGPDHVSALATLSANVSNRCDAFWLGIRWGLGHSTGLLLVATIFLVITTTQSNDVDEHVTVPEKLSHCFESLVGIFMIALGLYGIRRALHRRHKAYHALIVGGTDPAVGSEDDVENGDTVNDLASTPAMTYEEHLAVEHSIQQPDAAREIDASSQATATVDSTKPAKFCCCCDHLSTRTLALLAGIVHGLAGPGGVLGVIPAVQMRDAALATLYLTVFCVTSTVTMGVFAILYGTCSSRLAGGRSNEEEEEGRTEGEVRRAFVLECGSAGLSLVVGVLWLILLAVGKMDEIFP